MDARAMDTPLPSANAVKQQRWFLVFLLTVFIALSVQYSFKVCSDQRDTRSAFLRWRQQVLEMDDGVDIFNRHNYPNPPIMAIILEPLMELPPLAGALTWFYL